MRLVQNRLRGVRGRLFNGLRQHLGLHTTGENNQHNALRCAQICIMVNHGVVDIEIAHKQQRTERVRCTAPGSTVTA